MGKFLIQLSIFLVLVIHSCQSAVVQCDFSPGYCNVVNISDVTSASEQITVSGKPTTFKDTATTSVSFQSPMRLNYIPTGIFSIFPNIQYFYLSNTSLTNLVSNAFTNCGMLLYISLENNNFPDLPASFAPTCINITSLSLMTNNIQNLDTDALKGLTFLTTIMLRDNKISCIPPGFFSNTPIIQMIEISNNQITKLDPLTFRGLPNLNNIMLNSNKITSIPAFNFTLTGMTMGFSIMFGDNPISSVNPQFLTLLFTTRSGYMQMTNINLYDSYGNLTSCFPKNNMYTSMISYYNWPTANISLGECYGNWNAADESTPVSCAPPVNSTTTTIPITISTTPTSVTTPGTSGSTASPGGNGFLHTWANRSLFAIISDTMRNFTANIQFT